MPPWDGEGVGVSEVDPTHGAHMVRAGDNSVGPSVGLKWDLGKLSYCVLPPSEKGGPWLLESDQLRRTKVTP